MNKFEEEKIRIQKNKLRKKENLSRMFSEKIQDIVNNWEDYIPKHWIAISIMAPCFICIGFLSEIIDFSAIYGTEQHSFALFTLVVIGIVEWILLWILYKVCRKYNKDKQYIKILAIVTIILFILQVIFTFWY